jgi:hypothetical protein
MCRQGHCRSGADPHCFQAAVPFAQCSDASAEGRGIRLQAHGAQHVQNAANKTTSPTTRCSAQHNVGQCRVELEAKRRQDGEDQPDFTPVPIAAKSVHNLGNDLAAGRLMGKRAQCRSDGTGSYLTGEQALIHPVEHSQKKWCPLRLISYLSGRKEAHLF